MNVMNLLKKPFLYLLLSFFPLTMFSQNQGNFWYFGDNAGIDFNSGTAVALANGAMQTNEGCATISDDNGALLFYTDGITVWNSNHTIMPNGTGLLGDFSSTQSGVIIRRPGSANLYLIFTVDNESGPNGLRYSEVDMNLQGGLGDVTAIKNVALVGPTCEKITAIRSQNGQGFWIVTKLYNSNAFHSYLLTATGVNTTPVVSNIGATITTTNSTIGYLKASPNGSWVAAANWDLNSVDLMSFNNSTGVLSNLITLSNFTQGRPYGVEFSPNSNLLYVGEAATSTNNIYQYNLLAGNQIAINASRITLGTTPQGGALQLAPDKKIYYATFASNALGTIDNPNIVGAGANFTANNFPLAVGSISRFGLPTFFNSILAPSFTVTNLCFGDSTLLAVDTTFTSVDSVLWNFGDPTTGVNDTSTSLSAYHVFSAADTFDVSLISYQSGSIDTVIQQIIILPLPPVDLGADTTLCQGETLLLDATITGGEYFWQDATTNPTFTVVQPGVFSVTVIVGSCVNTDSINVSYNPLPTFSFGADTALCDGETYTLSTGIANADYLWQDGSTNPTFTVSSPGIYWAEVTVNNCSFRDSINISYTPLPVVNMGNDTTLCTGTTLPISFNFVAGTYLWSDGSTLPSFTVTQPGLYWVEITVNNCSSRDSIDISYLAPPSNVFLGNDTIICNSESLPLDIFDADASAYLWNDNSTGSSLTVSTPGLYWGQAENFCGSDRDTIIVSYELTPEVNLGNDTTLCDGETLPLDATWVTPTTTYVWTSGETTPDIVVTSEGVYSVTATNFCGAATDDIEVNYMSPPAIVDFGPDTLLCTGSTLTLNTNQPENNHVWHDNSSATSFTITRAGTYWVWVDNMCGAVNDTITATYIDPPMLDLGDDLLLCDGDDPFFDITWPGGTYLWDDGNTSGTRTITTSGIYSVELFHHCGDQSDEIAIEFQDRPMPVDLGPDQTLCGRDSLILELRQGGFNHRWQDGSQENTYTVRWPGTYTLRVFNECGEESDQITVDYLPIPKANLVNNDTIICEDDFYELTIKDPHPSYGYVWQDGSNFSAYPVITDGFYVVAVTNDCGVARDSINVGTHPCFCSMYAPTGFTPNADTYNDEFYLQYDCDIISGNFKIFDRWGGTVFAADNLDARWDGTFRGRNIPEGVYVWVIEYVYQDAERIRRTTETGTVTLIR
jgi:gliding motility-associated-like protein